MNKKYFVLPLLVLSGFLPLGMTTAQARTDVTAVRVVTRNDADVPFVRTVVETEEPVKPTATLSADRRTLIVTIPGTELERDVDKQPQADRHVISKIEIKERGSRTEVRIDVPQALTAKDYKIFTLPGNEKKHIVDRVVIDINDKSGKIRQWNHWHDAKDSISKPFNDAINKDFKGTPVIGKGEMIWPVKGVITSPFGYRMHPIYGRQILHSGIDIGVDYGTPVKAALGGVVLETDWMSGYGNTVVIDHGKGLMTLYGHNQKLAVKQGDQVKQGDIIAYAGSTGNSTGPHVHFEIRVNGEAVDPTLYL